MISFLFLLVGYLLLSSYLFQLLGSNPLTDSCNKSDESAPLILLMQQPHDSNDEDTKPRSLNPSSSNRDDTRNDVTSDQVGQNLEKGFSTPMDIDSDQLPIAMDTDSDADEAPDAQTTITLKKMENEKDLELIQQELDNIKDKNSAEFRLKELYKKKANQEKNTLKA